MLPKIWKSSIIIIGTISKGGEVVMAFRVDTTTAIGELLRKAPEAAPVLMSIGMHCIGWPGAQMESLGEAAMVHGIEPELLVEKINAFLNAQA